MKQYKAIFTPRAKRRLDDLHARIADDSGGARAEKFIGGIVNDSLSLSTFPERGNKRDDIRPNPRIKGYAKIAAIALSVDAADGVAAIHGVFYGGREYEPLLRDVEGDD